MLKKTLFALVVLTGFLGSARPAMAGCTLALVRCYERAAREDGFWIRWVEGLDCELEYTGCVRRVLLG